MRSRLSEGLGEVNNRFLILPPAAALQAAAAPDLKLFSPVTLVWTNDESTAVLNRWVGPGPIVSSSFDASARKPCVVRPFDVSDYKWKCSAPK
jgi:hypothetical protein